MQAFTYKQSQTTSMKLVGVLNIKDMTIDLNETGEESLSTLLSPFENQGVTITVKVTTDEELDMPTED